jgi:recombinational DNA repair ATPase RecF
LFNRLNFVQKIAEFFKEINVIHTVDVQNQYVSMLKNKETFSSIEQRIVKDLIASREADKTQNRNAISMNDVDYQLTFSGKNSCFASSGQQKLLGSLIAIGTGYFAQKSHNGVIILLDDITAKIDEKNQNFLHSIIEFSNCQTVITTINLPANHYYCINLI